MDDDEAPDRQLDREHGREERKQRAKRSFDGADPVGTCGVRIEPAPALRTPRLGEVVEDVAACEAALWFG